LGASASFSRLFPEDPMKKTFSVLLKSYLYKNAINDAWKFIRKNAKDLDIDWDFDRERWLHKVGLAEYEPGKAFFGSVSFLIIGALAGGVAALALAPKKGEELRTEVKDRAMMLFNRSSEKASQASPMA
jgi:hypothetical protein